MPQAIDGAPNNSLKLTRRAGPLGGAPGPTACRQSRKSPASAGQLHSRPLDCPTRPACARGLAISATEVVSCLPVQFKFLTSLSR